MTQVIGQVALVMREYDEALDFSVGTLSFTLVEDTSTPEQDKRWVVVAPPGARASRLLLARAVGEEQASRIGNQTGGRVFLFLETDDAVRVSRRQGRRGAQVAKDHTLKLGMDPKACFGEMQLTESAHTQIVVAVSSEHGTAGQLLDVYDRSRAGPW